MFRDKRVLSVMSQNDNGCKLDPSHHLGQMVTLQGVIPRCLRPWDSFAKEHIPGVATLAELEMLAVW